MTQIDIHQLAELVIAKMPINTHIKLDFSKHENGGLHFSVDGITAATSIGVWSNGYCDIEYMTTNSEEFTAHYEFSALSDAVETIIAELRKALERVVH